jgi:hypothetical protein
MHRWRAALASLLALGSGPSAGALPFDGTLGLNFQGAFYPVEFRLAGQASAGAGGSLQVDAAAPSSQPTVLYGPGFYLYLAFFPRDLDGTLAPSQGPGGGFGGSLQHSLYTFGLVGPPYATACFGVDRIGRALGAFGCGTAGTLVHVTGWTTGNVTVTGLGGPALQARGSDARTPGGLGQLVLVTPIKIEGGLHGSPLGGIGTLSFAFVPEPQRSR